MNDAVVAALIAERFAPPMRAETRPPDVVPLTAEQVAANRRIALSEYDPDEVVALRVVA